MATFFAMDELKIEDFAIIVYNFFKNNTKIQLFAINYNLFAVIYNQFKVSLTVVDSQWFKWYFLPLKS